MLLSTLDKSPGSLWEHSVETSKDLVKRRCRSSKRVTRHGVIARGVRWGADAGHTHPGDATAALTLVDGTASAADASTGDPLCSVSAVCPTRARPSPPRPGVRFSRGAACPPSHIRPAVLPVLGLLTAALGRPRARPQQPKRPHDGGYRRTGGPGLVELDPAGGGPAPRVAAGAPTMGAPAETAARLSTANGVGAETPRRRAARPRTPDMYAPLYRRRRSAAAPQSRNGPDEDAARSRSSSPCQAAVTTRRCVAVVTARVDVRRRHFRARRWCLARIQCHCVVCPQSACRT